jgi:hypothetical protein
VPQEGGSNRIRSEGGRGMEAIDFNSTFQYRGQLRGAAWRRKRQRRPGKAASQPIKRTTAESAELREGGALGMHAGEAEPAVQSCRLRRGVLRVCGQNHLARAHLAQPRLRCSTGARVARCHCSSQPRGGGMHAGRSIIACWGAATHSWQSALLSAANPACRRQIAAGRRKGRQHPPELRQRR